MTPEFRGVMAAPNRCRIEAKVLSVEQDSSFSDKWYLEMNILETQDLEGPNFARVGQTVKGFAFDLSPEVSPDTLITAEAEFVGDERGGQFRLTEVEILASE
jgi:hypothetical protein